MEDGAAPPPAEKVAKKIAKAVVKELPRVAPGAGATDPRRDGRGGAGRCLGAGVGADREVRRQILG